jgi:glycerol-1-phosphate dehydrogenase [NAD(P)+]
MFYQNVSLPLIFHIEKGSIYKIVDIIESKNFCFKKIFVVTGKAYSKNLLNYSNLNYFESYVVLDNNKKELDSLIERLHFSDFDLIISLGGGKVIDFSKRLSLLMKINLIIVPTIVSNDGLMSPISVIQTDHGFTESLPGAMPLGIIIDTDIIFNAPEKYFIAAAGDILSNVSATNDWFISNKFTYEKINDLGYHLSRMSAFATICYNNINFNDTGFKRLILECQVNSGISMSLSGSSRPCSGSEHLISHTLDYLNYDTDTLHGYKVGCLSLFSLFLQNKLTKEIYFYSKKINLNPYYIINVLEFLQNILPDTDIIKLFKSMRRYRYTILDQFDQYDIYKLSKEYICQIEFFENS